MGKKCNEKTVTVVIPCYNGVSHISRAIQSVINQTYEYWELIVVDDGSTDDSGEVVREFNDSRIRLVQQENQGVSAARNRGVNVAMTEWIGLLDADDEWMPTFLEEAVESLNQYPHAIGVFTGYEILPQGLKKLAHLPETPILVHDYFDFVLTFRQGMCSSCSVIKRVALERVGGFPVGVTHGEDTDTWARLGWTGDLVCLPKTLAVYHTDTPHSAMKTPLNCRIDVPKVWLSYHEWLKNGLIPQDKLESTERYISYRMFRYVVDLIDVGNKKEGRKFAKELEQLGLVAQRQMILRALLAAPGSIGVKLWRIIGRARKSLQEMGIELRLKV